MMLPIDVSRCWGWGSVSMVCPKRERCARYRGRFDHDGELRFPPSHDRMCVVTFRAFIDANNYTPASAGKGE